MQNDWDHYNVFYHHILMHIEQKQTNEPHVSVTVINIYMFIHIVFVVKSVTK